MSDQPRFAVRSFTASALLALALIYGCQNGADSTGNSNTNWLRECREDSECGRGLACLCRTCTIACAAESGCGALGATATCSTGGAAAATCALGAAPTAGLCLASCAAGGTCSNGQQCVDGACVAGATDTPDAAASGGATSTGGAGGSNATGGSSVGGRGETGGASVGGTGGAIQDAGSDATRPFADGGPNPTSCVGSCAPGYVCVELQGIGGALRLANDAGMCPPPLITVPESLPDACWNPPSFQCVRSPADCASVADCACMQALCPASNTCTEASATHVRCLARYP
jgi:hypothetical protein